MINEGCYGRMKSGFAKVSLNPKLCKSDLKKNQQKTPQQNTENP